MGYGLGMNTLEVQLRQTLDQRWEEWTDAALLEPKRLIFLIERVSVASKATSTVLSQDEWDLVYRLVCMAAAEAHFLAGRKVASTQKEDVNGKE